MSCSAVCIFCTVSRPLSNLSCSKLHCLGPREGSADFQPGQPSVYACMRRRCSRAGEYNMCCYSGIRPYIHRTIPEIANSPRTLLIGKHGQNEDIVGDIGAQILAGGPPAVADGSKIPRYSTGRPKYRVPFSSKSLARTVDLLHTAVSFCLLDFNNNSGGY